MAADDASPASLVLHSGGLAAHGASDGIVGAPSRSSRQDRAGLADRVSAPPHAGPAQRAAGHHEPHRRAGQPARCHARCPAEGWPMNERLTFSQILLLSAYAIGMSCGQVLFKMAAMRPAFAQGARVGGVLTVLKNS